MDGNKAVFLGKLIREIHESTCAHCQAGSKFPSLKRMFDHVDICRSCMKLICLRCYDKMSKGIEGCVPAEERIAREEREAALKAKIERDRWGCY